MASYNTESPRDRADRFELGTSELLPFTVDWGRKYLAEGQAITDSSWDVPDELTLDASSFSDDLTVVWLQWDTVELPDPVGRTVRVTNTATVDGKETVQAILEIVGVSHTGVAV